MGTDSFEHGRTLILYKVANCEGSKSVKVDMLEELVRGDGCRDIRGIGVCGAGWFGRDEEDPAQVSIDDVRSKPLEFGEHLDERLAHEAVDEAVYARVVHVGRGRANPSPEVIDRQ